MLRFQQTPEIPLGHQFLSSDYAVRINGKDCDVRSCRVSAMPYNCLWPGHQRPLDQTELASYISFESDGPVDLRVTPLIAFGKPVVRPLSKGIVPGCKNGIITFRLEKPGFYVLELEDAHKVLHIFFNVPEEFPEKANATYYFGPGIHYANKINVKDNDSIYIDRDAVVYGAIKGDGVKNVRIFGHGVLDGSSFERVYRNTYLELPNNNMFFVNSADIRISGVILMASPTWTAAFFHCEDVQIDNVKVVGQWRYNSDGIDFSNSVHCSVKHTFVRCFDDVLVIKGIPDFESEPCSDISFEDCVLWCDWGRTCEVGAETWGSEISHIRFEDCDLIHNSNAALDIQAAGPAPVHDIVFKNLRVEYQAYNMIEVYQAADEEPFTPQCGTMRLLCVENERWVLSAQYSVIKDVTFQDIAVTVEGNAPLPKIMLISSDREMENPYVYPVAPQWNAFHCLEAPFEIPEVEFGRITLDNVTINGKKLTDIHELPCQSNKNATGNLEIK